MNKTIAIVGVIIVILVIAGVLAATLGHKSNNTTPATTSQPATVQYSIKTITSAQYGTYLANQAGYALYTYSNDKPNSGNSTCYSSCAQNWPPFYTANLTLAPGLSATSFGTITRTDGTKQLTYDGMPLYLFIGDHSPGTVNGNGIAGFAVAKT